MTKHIGIVACSAEGAALCYRTICIEGEKILGRYNHPEITMHTFPLGEYMKLVTTSDWDGVAELMIQSAQKLAQGGADFAICPDNTIHQAFDRVAIHSPIPWLHIADSVVDEAERRNFNHVALLGTRFLMEGPVYPKKFEERGIQFSLPNEPERIRINDIIFNELVYGRVLDRSKTYLYNVITRLKNEGCNAVALSCTELPLIVLPDDSPLPPLDSTRLLAQDALKKATE